MSSAMDPSKMKVVDLRQELSQRGLDTKGNKPALVKRLKDALEKELKQELPDTSIADTSTEDLDTSQNEEVPKKGDESSRKASEEKMEVEQAPPKSEPPKTESKPAASPQKPIVSPQKQAATPQKAAPSPQKQAPSPQKEAAGPQRQGASPQKPTPAPHSQPSPQKQPEVQKQEIPLSDIKVENGEHAAEENASAQPSEDASEPMEDSQESKPVVKIEEQDAETKGEKRKRDDSSPDRAPKKREKSPIKEDEPAIDENKVQLSWYDSDLHLLLDRESFLSARPLHDGVFGYAWAGARSSHGVSSGQVYYEVKLTEELKWDDLGELWNKERQNRERNKNRRFKDQSKSKEKKDEESKPKDKPQEGETEEKMETEEAQKDPESKTELESEEKPTEEKPAEEKETPQEEEEEEKKEEEKPEEEEAKPKEEETDKEDDIAVVIDPPALPTHLFRVGFSLGSCGLQLGEEKYSYAYESTGRFVTESKFEDYGVPFSVGDVVGAFLSISSEEVTIIYTVNGEEQGTAITVPRSELPEENFVFFAHVLSRNCVFEVNLGDNEEPWFPVPDSLAEYVPLAKAEEKVAGPRRPDTREECEVILMVGLPSSGKSHWVKHHVQENPDKKYNVIGNTFIERMTFDGEPLKSKFKGRWNILTDRLQKCHNKLIDIASTRRRNYIFDQTNVYPSAQRRKLRSFEGFRRRAVVVVVGDEELARRQAEMEAGHGKDYPDHVVLEMKANMSLPAKCEWLDEVDYAEMNEEETKEQVKKYNEAGKQAGYGGQRRIIRRDDRFGYNRRNDYRGGGRNYYDRPYARFDRRGPPPAMWNRPGGGWQRDRRDNRGPPARDWNRSRGPPQEQSGRAGNGYGRQGGGGGQGWRQTWAGHSNWNQQTFGHHGGGGQPNWGKYDQGGYGGQGSGYGGQGDYGGQGGYGSNWNYYGQYGQQGGWSQGGQQQQQQQYQPAAVAYGAQGQQQAGAGSQDAWAQYAQQYAAQQQQNQQQAWRS